MRFYLTTAIDYVNSRPHLGTAYEKVTADVIARYKRGMGAEVRFLMGNDEHSLKVAQAAREQGLTPDAWCDRMETVFREAWSALDVEPDDFIRTTEPRHVRAVTEMVRRIHERGDLYQGSYEGWYCIGCEAFKRGEDLEDERCPQHPNRQPQWLKEQNWFFRLSAYRDRRLEHYTRTPGFVQPETRRNELLALLGRGLDDVSVSRASVDWGVPFPFDPDAVVYVWFDALVNYVAGVGFPDDQETFDHWWPADLHLIGKDITRFHCIIWPAMLMSAGLELPRLVFGHGFVNLGGGRMSKDAGHVTDPQELARLFGADAVRYYLCREATFGSDLEYTEERLTIRANSDLANGIGNLASRTTAMIVKYRDGDVGPCPSESPLLDRVRDACEAYVSRMDALDLKGGIEAAMSIVEAANAHVDRTAPYTLAKDPARKHELQVVLAELVNALLVACRLLHPVMPSRMGLLHRHLAGEDVDPSTVIRGASAARLPPGRQVQKAPPLFPRIEAAEEPSS